MSTSNQSKPTVQPVKIVQNLFQRFDSNYRDVINNYDFDVSNDVTEQLINKYKDG